MIDVNLASALCLCVQNLTSAEAADRLEALVEQDGAWLFAERRLMVN